MGGIKILFLSELFISLIDSKFCASSSFSSEYLYSVLPDVH